MPDKIGISKMNTAKKGLPPYMGLIFTISNGSEGQKILYLLCFLIHTYIGVDRKYKIGFAYPVAVNNTKDGYIGSIVVVIPASEFFKLFGKMCDVKSPYLSVLYRKAVEIVHPLPELLSKLFLVMRPKRFLSIMKNSIIK